MPSDNFNSNSFAPFLETISKSASKAAPTASGLVILEKLAAAPNSRMEMASLLAASDLPLDTFAGTLKELEAAGLLATQIENGKQVAILNSLGQQIARGGAR